MTDWIDLTNCREHPTNRAYQVFHFTKSAQATYFQGLLDQEKISYERHNETREDGVEIYYFAVPKRSMKQVLHLNNLAIGKFRNKFIPDKGLRWVVILISMLVLGLAFVGYFKSIG